MFEVLGCVKLPVNPITVQQMDVNCSKSAGCSDRRGNSPDKNQNANPYDYEVHSCAGSLRLRRVRLGSRDFGSLYRTLQITFPRDELPGPQGARHMMLSSNSRVVAWVTGASREFSAAAHAAGLLPGSTSDGFPESWPLLQDGSALVLVFCAMQLTVGQFGAYLAVHPALRCLGIGAAFLRRELHEIKKRNELCVLEVERPISALSKRRIAAYERLGIKLSPLPYYQPPLHRGLAPLPLHLMSYPYALDPEMHVRWARSIAREVYQRQDFDPCAQLGRYT